MSAHLELDWPDILSLDDLLIDLPQDVYNHLSNQYSQLENRSAVIDDHLSSHLEKILGCMKTSPADTCCRVNLIKASTSEVVDGLREHIAKMENTSHVFVVQQHEAITDLVVIMSKPKPNNSDDGISYSCSVPGDTRRNNIFPHWPTRSDKGWPMSHRAVIVDRFCGEAVMRGANVFVRGILCADAGIAAHDEVAVYADIPLPQTKSVPRGLMLEKYSGKCVFLGVGTSCCKRSEYFAQSSGLGIRMVRTAGPPQLPLNSILPGKMMLQNLPSVLVAHALEPRKGEVILDMCSAPGGKTSHLASLINNEGLVIACDKSRKKMLRARDFFQSMGATCAVPLALDSTKILLDLERNQNWKSPKQLIASATSKDGLSNVNGFYPNSFDRILLDPPCSALGLRPKLTIDAQSAQDLSKIANYQRRFVRNAVHLLKPGGTMTYSTCTINASENEDIVKFTLTEFPNVKLKPIPHHLPGLPGLSDRGLTDEECQMVRRFDPSDKGDTMGFFLAKFVKVN
ncbi:hypothetical protein ACHAWF_004158 [Thalassiosira exigua]